MIIFNPQNCKSVINHSVLLIRKISSTEQCIETIKKYDYENFICTLLLKKEARVPGIAIRAFNVEVARSQDYVTNPTIAAMKYTWWEEAIEDLFRKQNDKILNHPIIVELHRVLKSHKLSKRHLLSLIKIRKDFLTKNKFVTIEDMETYAEKSVSPVYYLLLEAAGINNVHADHVASHLGKAQGICQLLRTIPMAKNTNLITLPQKLLIEHGISEEDVLRQKDSKELRDVVFHVATRSNQHLEKARSLSDKVPNEVKSIFLPATIINDYLEKLLLVDCNVFDTKLQRKSRMWIPKVWLMNYRRKF